MNTPLAQPLARCARSRNAKCHGVLRAAKRCPRPRSYGCRRRGHPVPFHRPRTPLPALEMLVIVVGSPGPSPACFCSKHATRPATYDSPADDHARHPSPLPATEDSEEYVGLVGSGTPRYDAGGDRASTRPGPLAPHRATRPEQDDAAPRARA
ncbi:hypothetical protein B0H16DRAFT_1628395 [Mycena metata]|uniref:Uncharacterized protein n=1 Tax=Mycena metata TaxID=1033252 RepID=A0AAD7H404_9AGAR|nr:hypothetical protein B0H16DRAFT_1628395 [Mycena metata]